MISRLRYVLVWFWLRLKYMFVCHLGWSCNRNFTNTLGCIHCRRTGFETWKGRRYYGKDVCDSAVSAMRARREDRR